jgi:hypothetical protein
MERGGSSNEIGVNINGFSYQPPRNAWCFGSMYICSSWYYKYDWRTVQLHAHRDTIERTNTSTKKPSRDERGQFGRPRALASPLFPHTRGSVRALFWALECCPQASILRTAASPKSTGPPHQDSAKKPKSVDAEVESWWFRHGAPIGRSVNPAARLLLVLASPLFPLVLNN